MEKNLLSPGNNCKTSAFKLGCIVSVISERASVRFEGENSSNGKLYARLSSYFPSIGDRVLMAKISGTYVILGKVV